LSRRHGRLDRGQGCLCLGHVDFHGVAVGQLVARDLELFLGQRNDLPRGIDLGTDRRLFERRADDVRGQAQVGRLELEALHLGLCIQGLDLATVQTEHVGQVAHGQLRGMEVIDDRLVVGGLGARPGRDHGAVALDARRIAARVPGELLPFELVVRLQRREEIPFLGIDLFLGLAQRGLRRGHARIGSQRLLDQGIQGR
jgi:hypothetical protein